MNDKSILRLENATLNTREFYNNGQMVLDNCTINSEVFHNKGTLISGGNVLICTNQIENGAFQAEGVNMNTHEQMEPIVEMTDEFLHRPGESHVLQSATFIFFRTPSQTPESGNALNSPDSITINEEEFLENRQKLDVIYLAEHSTLSLNNSRIITHEFCNVESIKTSP